MHANFGFINTESTFACSDEGEKQWNSWFELPLNDLASTVQQRVGPITNAMKMELTLGGFREFSCQSGALGIENL
jgi:hypothetical protein